MPRNHARVFTSIWDDPDWLKLDQGAQHLYLALCSQKRLSYCGVLDYIPGRIANLAGNLTEQRVRTATKALERSKYIVVDTRTHELLVRSYVRHDGVMKRRNMGNAVARALGVVISQTVREAILTELARLWIDEPGAEGWAGFKDFDPMAFAMACDMASDMACDDARAMAHGKA